MRGQFRESPACYFGEILFVVVSFLPQATNKGTEPLKKFHEYASTDVKRCACPLRDNSSIRGLTTRRVGPSPYAVRSATHSDRQPSDGGQASQLRGGLQ